MRIAALLLAWPLVELALLILAGSQVGFWPVMLWLIAAGLAGGWLVRFGGRQAAMGMQALLREGGVPGQMPTGGAMTVLAGVLLIVPGLVSDAAAVVLLLPPVRRYLARRFTPAGAGGWGMVWQRGTSGSRGQGAAGDTGVIEGQYEVIGDRALPGRDPHPGGPPDHRH